MQSAWLARLAVAAMLAVGSLSWLPDSGSAQQAPSAQEIATARELLTLKRGDVVFKPIITGVVETVKNFFLPTNPQLSRELNEVALQLRKEYEIKQPELLNEVAKVYAEKFSEQELKALITFYKSPLGQKMVAEEPVIIDESMRRVQTWGDALSSKVMDRFREEMKKKGHTL
jgi:hypothetical protein